MYAVIKLPVTFSVEKMVYDLDVIGRFVWKPVIGRKGSNWSGAALRSHDGLVETLDCRGSGYMDTPLLRSMPYFQEVVSFFECDLCRTRLLAMRPGTVIGEHTDVLPGKSPKQVRLHLPVITNNGVSFEIAGESVTMGPGELWFLDVTRRHSVANRGTADRIHLVIDCVVNDWLNTLIASGEPNQPS